MRASTLTVVSGAAGLAAAAAVAQLPSLHWVWRAPSQSIVLETTVALVASLTAFLVFGRFRRSALVGDLAIVYAFAVLALATLLPPVLPRLLEANEEVGVAARVRLGAGIVAGLAVAFAAIARERRFEMRRAGPAIALAVGLLAPAVGVGLVLAVDPTVGSTAGELVALRSIAAALFAVAAVGFALRADRAGDELTKWLAAGCAVSAVARFLYVLDPGDPIGSIHIADVGRLASALLLLVGAMREIAGYWRGLGVLEERRRIARELHDGMAQELAFIATQARKPMDAISLYRIAAAAERALDESRRAILALTRPVDQPLDEAIAQTAEEVASRAGARVRFDLAAGVRVPPDVRENLVRIVREAVANATRHGRAATVHVRLAADGSRLRLVVTDDGRGFDSSGDGRSGRFGLTSMEQRARALGGRFALRSNPGTGTEVEVELPWSA